MKRFKTLLRAAAGAVALAALAAPAAAIVVVPADCSTITSIDAWQLAGSCDIGDKRFTFIDTDLNLTPYTDDFEIQFSNPNGLLTYSFIGKTPIVGGQDVLGDTEFVTYSVQVLDPAYRITLISVDSDVTNGGLTSDTSVTKSIYDSLGGTLLDTITSLNGSTDTSIGLSLSYVVINDFISVGENDQLNSFNNTLFQSQVPEPATLGLLGLGLVGLAMTRRRRGNTV